MEVITAEETVAYKEAVASRAALGHELFELLVKEEWYSMLTVALQKWEYANGTTTYSYLETPDFIGSNRRGYNYIGCWEARKYKSEALGERLDDDKFKELVSEVLKEELEKYNVELRLMTRHSLDGSDKVLRVYPRS